MDFLGTFLKSGILDCLDAVSVHPYRNYSKPPETAVDDYSKLRKLIEQNASTAEKKNLPIISGEWGYASHTKGVTQETQAAYLVRQQLANLLAGVPISIWYDWKNDGQDPAEGEHNFGTVTFDLEPKPAYRAAQTLTSQLAGYRIDRRLNTENANDYVLLCRNSAGDQKLVAWTLNPPKTVSLYITEVTHPLSAIGWDGRQSPVKVEPKGIVLPLGQAPIYIHLDRAKL
jgi:hypothetical protein